MNTRIPWIVAAVVAAVAVFLGIKLQDKPREVIKEVPVDRVVEKKVEVIKEVPVQVIKEVPVEVIKQVPVEVVKQVEKPIPPAYAAERELGVKFQNARLAAQDQKLKGVKSVYVSVTLPDEVKGSASESGLKEKIEQELRKSGIQVADKPSATENWLSYSIEVFRPEGRQTLAYITSLNLLGTVYVSRGGEISKTTALLWTAGKLGSLGADEAYQLGDIYERDLKAFIDSQRKANSR